MATTGQPVPASDAPINNTAAGTMASASVDQQSRTVQIAVTEVAQQISNNSGPVHLAAAVGTPVVALFGPTDPARNGPFDPDDVVVRRTPACAPCYSRTCLRHAGVMDEVSVEEVLSAVERRLAAAGRRVARAL